MNPNPCHFDSSWGDFQRGLKAIPWDLVDHGNIEQFCDDVHVDHTDYERIKEIALFGWKHSTSCSVFDFLSNHDMDNISSGMAVFQTLLEQTRFIHYMRERGILRFACERVRQDGKTVKLKGEDALYIPDHGSNRFNHVLRMIYLYQRVCQAIWDRGVANKEIKTPKYLYRGQFPLWFGEGFQRAGLDRGTGPVHRIDRMIDYLINNGISILSDREWVSTTSSLSSAKFFAGRESFIVRIPFDAVKRVLTSVKQEPIFAEKDSVSGRMENEYVVQIDPEWKPQREDFMVFDRYYLAEHASPWVVHCLNHHDIVIRYQMGDRWVEAQYLWSSNRSGQVCFKSHGYDSSGQHYYMGRKGFKEKYGFDPMPSKKNVNEIGKVMVAKDRGVWSRDGFKDEQIFATSTPSQRKKRWFERVF